MYDTWCIPSAFLRAFLPVIVSSQKSFFWGSKWPVRISYQMSTQHFFWHTVHFDIQKMDRRISQFGKFFGDRSEARKRSHKDFAILTLFQWKKAVSFSKISLAVISVKIWCLLRAPCCLISLELPRRWADVGSGVDRHLTSSVTSYTLLCNWLRG